MKTILLATSIVFTCCLTAPNVFAGDIAAGKQKAATCAGCHGANGISTNPQWPNLAGQNAPYIVLQLKAFKSGTRKSAIMQPMAQSLSEADMDNVAAYFSSLQPSR